MMGPRFIVARPLVASVPLSTARLKFRWWTNDARDVQLAHSVWGDPEVNQTLGLSLRGAGPEQTAERLELEIRHAAEFGLQYWPVFKRGHTDESQRFIGVVGFRRHEETQIELGFHLRPECWRRGYAVEAATAALDHAFGALGLDAVLAGHGPGNTASRRTIERLGFSYTHVGTFEGEPDMTYELSAAAWLRSRRA